MNTPTRWLLAYDARCGTCRKISGVVEAACRARLEVVPMGRADVSEWRRQAYRGNPPWRPTLLRLRGDTVRGWSGPAMALPLVRGLGPVSTLRVITALGRYRQGESHPATDGRPRGLRSAAEPAFRLLLGAIAVAGLLLTGKPPMPAARENAEIARWIAANRDRLPQEYDEVTAYPKAYQTAIYTASPPEVQSRMWIERLTRERRSRPEVTPEQDRVFAEAISLAAFMCGPGAAPALNQRLTALEHAARSAFDEPRDRRVVFRLALALRSARLEPAG